MVNGLCVFNGTMREYLVNLIIHGHWSVFSIREYLVNLIIHGHWTCFQCVQCVNI